MVREAAYPIHQLLLDRWSPRAMSGQSITHQDLMSLFEAARWAPSSYNGQPWIFLYAKRDTSYWDIFFNLMVPFNQSWACNAAVLLVVASRLNFVFNNKPSRTHSFDCGAACQNLALQASAINLVCHAMEGFDYQKAHNDLKLPSDYAVEAMVAIGKPGPLSVLPQQLQEREKPSDRNPISTFIFEGSYKC
jgi:nitroreductase